MLFLFDLKVEIEWMKQAEQVWNFLRLVSQMSTNFQQSSFKNFGSEHGILSFLDCVQVLLEIVQNYSNYLLLSLLILLKWEEECVTCL